jgi:para-nitrobenzyl esterase
MKKPMLVLSLLMFAVFSLGIFTGPVQAGNKVNRSGLLMDPIKIEGGYIAGTVFGNPDDPIRIYRGIPYAAPPVGHLRWKPPQPPAKWSGIRESVSYSTHPVQFRPGRYYPVGDPESEDCLYLNVLTPAKSVNEKLPVIVWFHGGGLEGASGNDVTWNSHRLPQQGVVVVTVNTRLGALGLLAHPDLTAESTNHVSGNYMFMDMIAALQWVRGNVNAFGGDFRNITILGESGGGAKVAGLLASPLAKGLFHKAIIQSGGYVYPAPLSELEKWGTQYFAKLGVNSLAEARSLAWQNLVKAYTAMPPAPGSGAGIDGWFLTDTPPNVFSSGRQNVVPIIVQAVLGELPIKDFMPTMIDFYVKLLKGNINSGSKGYAAIFNQVPPNWKKAGVQSFHALDLAYTFGIYDDPYADMWKQMTARTAAKVPPDLGNEDKLISEAMMTMFAQFAKTGNPNVKSRAKGLVLWHEWDPSRDEYLYLDNGIQIKSGFSRLQ